MAVKLADVKDVEKVAAPLRIVEAGTGKASALAVAERQDGTLLLVRKSSKAVKDADGKAVKDADDKAVTETVYKPTAVVADIARAIGSGLLA